MVFSTTNLFKGIPCPEGRRCMLTNCIYGHDIDIIAHTVPKVPAANALLAQSKQAIGTVSEPASKRRRITYESLADKPPSRADRIRAELSTVRAADSTTPPPNSDGASHTSVAVKAKVTTTPPSLQKSISPPTRISDSINTPSRPAPSNGMAATKRGANGKPKIAETLNPRLIPNDPAGHTKRALYLKYLHAELVRLNNEVRKTAPLPSGPPTVINDEMLIRIALDEEEKIAREQPTVYGNIVKQRIAALKKFSLDDWTKEVKAKLHEDEPKPTNDTKPIETGLTPSEEVCVLPLLVADQKPLAAHGYILNPPTAEQAAEAAAAVEASRNYEVCERCAGRFQVFPGRNEQGQLTSGGPCCFHPYRKVFPPRSKTDRETGQKEAIHPCCHQPSGSSGCTTHTDHVFKTSSPARLAATFPFITTPANANPKPIPGSDVVAKGVTFDCEMGYTTDGLELIRLTAVAWPQHELLVDVLVRPLGTVIDLNSTFSGVFPESYQTAIPYDECEAAKQLTRADDGSSPLPMVESPLKARDLLCSFITPHTPLIGHAIDNDLNAVRLCHPTIIDTVILYPHPRKLPMRFGLKMLTQKYLGRFIQTGGERGHDSLEDAVATGDLVRAKVGEQWKSMRRQGWSFVDGQLISPNPTENTISEHWHEVKRRKMQGLDEAEENADGEGVEQRGSREHGLTAMNHVHSGLL